MKEITIKEIANGFVVSWRDPDIERQQMAMQYIGRSQSNEFCYNQLDDVIDLIRGLLKKVIRED